MLSNWSLSIVEGSIVEDRIVKGRVTEALPPDTPIVDMDGTKTTLLEAGLYEESTILASPREKKSFRNAVDDAITGSGLPTANAAMVLGITEEDLNNILNAEPLSESALVKIAGSFASDIGITKDSLDAKVVWSVRTSLLQEINNRLGVQLRRSGAQLLSRSEQLPEFPSFAAIITYYRTEKGWSQAELARRSGVAQPHVCQIEKGDPGRDNPRLSTILALAAALGVEPCKLIPRQS